MMKMAFHEQQGRLPGENGACGKKICLPDGHVTDESESFSSVNYPLPIEEHFKENLPCPTLEAEAQRPGKGECLKPRGSSS